MIFKHAWSAEDKWLKHLLVDICCRAIVNDTSRSEITVSNVYISDKVFIAVLELSPDEHWLFG